MKNWISLLLVLTIVSSCYIISASTQHQNCASRGGLCTKLDDRSCEKIPGFCTRGFRCCQKERPKAKLKEPERPKAKFKTATDRKKMKKCDAKKKCSKRGGTCIPKSNTCNTSKVDIVCKGSSCACCIPNCTKTDECAGKCVKKKKDCDGVYTKGNGCSGSKRCGCCTGKERCKIVRKKVKSPGGICVESKKSKTLCSRGTINKKGCKGKGCVYCLRQEKLCQCGKSNEGQSTRNLKVLNTTTSFPKPLKFPWKRNQGIRVVGGEKLTPQNKYPWLVGVNFTDIHDVGYICAGAIVNSRYVVTSAACIFVAEVIWKTQEGNEDNEFNPTSTIRVGIADFNQSSMDDDISGVTRLVEVANIKTHDKFNLTSLENFDYNIALLRLKEELDLISNDENLIKPVCLPTNKNEAYTEKDGVTVGWGLKNVPVWEYIDTPDEITLSILGPDCDGYTFIWPTNITKRVLCARMDKDSIKGPYHKDFGAPLTVESDDGRHVLVGLYSTRNMTNGPTNSPAVYTRITEFTDWIHDYIDEDGYPCP